jgi:hypothetical protein
MKNIITTEFILYVIDQQKSTDFYTKLFRINPDLNVPGMTEFKLSANCKLGLMPNKGIAKILSDKTPHLTKETAFRDVSYIFMLIILNLNLITQ